jgi:hypothetical protein
MIPLEITVKNEVPTRIFSMATIFLTVISRETYGNQILLHIFLLKPVFSSNQLSINNGFPRFP